jgi:hypothetical protein
VLEQLGKACWIWHFYGRPKDTLPVFDDVCSKVQPKRGSSGAALHGKMNPLAAQAEIMPLHAVERLPSVNEGSGVVGFARPMTLMLLGRP